MTIFKTRLRIRMKKPSTVAKGARAGMWAIRIQRRADYNGLYDRDDWRAWRDFMWWPILFKRQTDAQAYMNACFTFKGLVGRKMSASVNLIIRT